MNFPDKTHRFQTGDIGSQASIEKVISEYEKKTLHTAAQMAAFKLRAEKTFLQKKQEAMKRWMDRHREESKKTIVKVCNTARSIVERMAEEKKKEMEDMMRAMEKTHQQELRQLRIETRRATLRDFLQNNERYIDKYRLAKNIDNDEASNSGNQSNKTTSETTIENPHVTQVLKTEKIPPCHVLPCHVLPSDNTNGSASDIHEVLAKKAKLEQNAEKKPFCNLEMCVINRLHQPDPNLTQNNSKPIQTGYKDKPLHSAFAEENTTVQQRKTQSQDLNCSPNETTMTIEVNDSESEEDGREIVCNTCGKNGVGLLMCSGCFGIYYCDEQCQITDWKSHQDWCT